MCCCWFWQQRFQLAQRNQALMFTLITMHCLSRTAVQLSTVTRGSSVICCETNSCLPRPLRCIGQLLLLHVYTNICNYFCKFCNIFLIQVHDLFCKLHSALSSSFPHSQLSSFLSIQHSAGTGNFGHFWSSEWDASGCFWLARFAYCMFCWYSAMTLGLDGTVVDL